MMNNEREISNLKSEMYGLSKAQNAVLSSIVAVQKINYTEERSKALMIILRASEEISKMYNDNRTKIDKLEEVV